MEQPRIRMKLSLTSNVDNAAWGEVAEGIDFEKAGRVFYLHSCVKMEVTTIGNEFCSE